MEPDLGTALEILVIALAMLFVAGLSGKYILGAGVAAMPAIYIAVVHVSYRYERVMAFLHPERRSAGPRIPADAVADRRRFGRIDRRGLDGEQAEAFLSSRGAHGFYLRGSVRGAGIHRRRHRARAFRRLRLARAAQPAFALPTISAAFWRWASR